MLNPAGGAIQLGLLPSAAVERGGTNLVLRLGQPSATTQHTESGYRKQNKPGLSCSRYSADLATMAEGVMPHRSMW